MYCVLFIRSTENGLVSIVGFSPVDCLYVCVLVGMGLCDELLDCVFCSVIHTLMSNCHWPCIDSVAEPSCLGE